MKTGDDKSGIDPIIRRRLLTFALGIQIAVFVSALVLNDTHVTIDAYLITVTSLVIVSSVIAFLGAYKVLPISSVCIFSVGSLIPLMGTLLILLMRQRMDKIYADRHTNNVV